MIKVVHITSSTEGGAGIAAVRLHFAMMKVEDVESSLIQRQPLYDPTVETKRIFRCVPSFSILYRVLCKLKLTPYLTTEGKYIDKIDKSSKDYEAISIPVSYFRVEDHPLVQEADIIHLHWVSNFVDYKTFFAKVKQPIVWTLHDMNPFSGLFHYEGDATRNKVYFGKLDSTTQQLKSKYLHLKKNIYIVTLSEWMKRKSENSESLGTYPHFLIPNGMNFIDYPFIDKLEAKDQLKIDKESRTFFFISDNVKTKRKGFALLESAINSIDSINFTLITLGNGKVNLDNQNIRHIHFEATNDRRLINSLYTAADYTIIASEEDNLPNVMLESFANGTPIISFKNGGMAEHVKENINGIIVDQYNSTALKETIENVLNSQYTYNPHTIRQYAIDTFDEKIQSQQYINLYKRILEENE